MFSFGSLVYSGAKKRNSEASGEAPPRGELSDRAVTKVANIKYMRMTEGGCSNCWKNIL